MVSFGVLTTLKSLKIGLKNPNLDINSKNWARKTNANKNEKKNASQNFYQQICPAKKETLNKKVLYENWALAIRDEIFVKLFLKVFINWGQSCRHF